MISPCPFCKKEMMITHVFVGKRRRFFELACCMLRVLGKSRHGVVATWNLQVKKLRGQVYDGN